MKKLFTLLLAFLLLLSLTACDFATTPGDSNPSNSTPNGNPTENTAAGNHSGKNEITFTDLVVVDNAECMIKITGIDPDSMWGYALKVQLENKSADKTYMFSVQTASVNGVECDPLFATEVAAGKKSNKEINFPSKQLEEYGIDDFTDIELTFRVYDSNDWTADEVALETVHIYPYGEDKAVTFVREPQASDSIILDNEHATVIVTGYENDSIWGYTVNLFLINKTDTGAMFSVDEASVNGFMLDPIFATTVSAGKCAFTSMSWSDTNLEENGITNIEEIEFLLRVYNSDEWFEDDYASKKITLKP